MKVSIQAILIIGITHVHTLSVTKTLQKGISALRIPFLNGPPTLSRFGTSKSEADRGVYIAPKRLPPTPEFVPYSVVPASYPVYKSHKHSISIEKHLQLLLNNPIENTEPNSCFVNIYAHLISEKSWMMFHQQKLDEYSAFAVLTTTDPFKCGTVVFGEYYILNLDDNVRMFHIYGNEHYCTEMGSTKDQISTFRAVLDLETGSYTVSDVTGKSERPRDSMNVYKTLKAIPVGSVYETE